MERAKIINKFQRNFLASLFKFWGGK